MSPTLHVTADNKICHDDLMLKKHDQTLCCVNCFNCDNDKGPPAWKVVLDGIENKGGEAVCDDCGDYNDRSYIVPWLEYAPPSCWWQVYYTDPDFGCYDSFSIMVALIHSFDDYILQASFTFDTGGPSHHMKFETSLGDDKPDCNNLNDVDLALTGPTTVFQCDVDEATCTITSL